MPLIASVGAKPGGRSCELDNLGRRKYSVQYLVETTDPLVGPLAARAAVQLPIGTYYTNGLAPADPLYEFDQGAFVESLAAAESGESGIEWVVTVQYGPFDWTPFQDEAALWPIRVSVGGEHYERVIYFDNAGAAILNSAGDPFGDPIVVDDSRTVLTITRNEKVSTFDLTLAETYRDTINLNTWNGFAARTCKLGIITTSEPTYDPNGKYYYYTVTYPVNVDRATWKKQILDQGYNALNAATPPKLVPIMNQGQAVTEAVPLDGSGRRLPAAGTPVSRLYDVYTAADWAGLNLNLALRLGA